MLRRLSQRGRVRRHLLAAMIAITAPGLYLPAATAATVVSMGDWPMSGRKPYECFDPNNHVDSVLALDTRTGALKWAGGARRFDAGAASTG